ncbi:1-(5-phosphoribosyl)-5-[(5-phosphoribosylamino)methylideneamino]imidazole-4-carboxamide isomerase [bacterium]|nr:MAG: 1-(5-phosphoribosyl)-5-[(5-phosphoribosylamino)methylideneamino]imidazole-4-carboxamide isomerase [bacterium]
MRVIPAIDLYNQKVVRLKKGDYNQQTEYNLSPFEQAKVYVDAGFKHLHIVDLNGAKEGKFVNLPVIEEIIQKLNVSVQTGGGIRTFDDAKRLLDSGLSQLICSSIVVKNPSDWQKMLTELGGETCILGLDVKDGKLAYAGWLETSDETIEEFLKKYIPMGLKNVLSTDISRDGMLSGINVELYKQLQDSFPELDFIASGGLKDVRDLEALKAIDVYGVVVGKAYYEAHISLDEMIGFNG